MGAYAAYRAHALAYYQAGGVLTTQPASRLARERRARRDQQIDAPLSKDLCRRIKWLVKSRIMRSMPLEEFLAWASPEDRPR